MEWLFLYIPVAIGLAVWPAYQRFSANLIKSTFTIFSNPAGLLLALFVGVVAWLLLAAERKFFDIGDGSPNLIEILFVFYIFIPAVLGMLIKSVILPLATFIFWGFFLLLLPGAIVMVAHYIHFLTVPHPAEEVLRSNQELSQQELVDRVADAMYKPERDGIPEEWRSVNWRRRIEALTERLEAENTFMRTLSDKLRGKDRFDS